MFSLAGYPFENVATTVEPTKGGGNEGREEEEGSMNLGGGSSSPLSRARDYSDVMLMRMATKEISRWRGGGERRGWGREREEDGGEKGGERAEWWVGGCALSTHPPFSLPSRLSIR